LDEDVGNTWGIFVGNTLGKGYLEGQEGKKYHHHHYHRGLGHASSVLEEYAGSSIFTVGAPSFVFFLCL
jgi:hypothetical protein